MTISSHAGYPGDDPHPIASGVTRTRFELWRLGTAAVIVASVIAAIWLWGRPHSEPPPVLVAITSEAWMAGQPPGAFEVAGVPADLAGQFADPDAIARNVVAYDVPAGTFVTPALLAEPDDVAGGLTVMRFGADTSAWPVPGPRAGSSAVVATVLGGCALEVSSLVSGGDGHIVVRVDVTGAARFAAAADLGGLVVWPAPPDGWPRCSEHRLSSARLPFADAPAPAPTSESNPSWAGG